MDVNERDTASPQNGEIAVGGEIRSGGRLRIIRSKASDSEDLTLLARIAAKDEKALAALYDKYQRKVYSVLIRIIKDQEEASELMQDVFLQVWEKAELFDNERGNFDTWLFTLAHNKAINMLRSRLHKKRSREDNKDSIAITEIHTPATREDRTPLTEQIESDERRVMLSALDAIPSAQRDALYLAYYDGLSQSEISEKLSPPCGAGRGAAHHRS